MPPGCKTLLEQMRAERCYSAYYLPCRWRSTRLVYTMAEAKRTGSPLYGKLDWAGYYLLLGRLRRGLIPAQHKPPGRRLPAAREFFVCKKIPTVRSRKRWGKQEADYKKGAEQNTKKRRRSLLLAGTAPERQTGERFEIGYG